MDIDFIQFVRRLEAEASTSKDLAGSMVRLMTWANRQRPHADWQETAKFDAPAEVDAGRRWLRRVLVNKPTSFAARGAWFGLGEFVDENGIGFADLRVGLLGEYYVDDTSGQWLHSKPSWFPERAELVSPALRRAGLICNRRGSRDPAPLAAGGNLLFGTAFAVLLLSHVLDAEVFRLLGGKAPVGIATGFDSGDRLLIGELTAKGFVKNPRGFV